MDIFETAKEACSKLKISVENQDNQLIFNDWVTMYQDTIEVSKRSLKGTETKRVPGWVVDVSVMVCLYPSEPDDVDITVIGEFEDPYKALSLAINTIRELEVKNILDSVEMLDLILPGK